MAIQTPPNKKTSAKPGEDKMAQAQAAKRPPIAVPTRQPLIIKGAPPASNDRGGDRIVMPSKPASFTTPYRSSVSAPTLKLTNSNKGGGMAKFGGINRAMLPPGTGDPSIDLLSLSGPIGMVGVGGEVGLSAVQKAIAKFFPKGLVAAAVENPRVINAAENQALTAARLADFELMQLANSGEKPLTAVELALRDLTKRGVTFSKELQNLTPAQIKRWMLGESIFEIPAVAKGIPAVAKEIAGDVVRKKPLTAVQLALKDLAGKGVTFPKELQKLTDAQIKKWMLGDISFSKIPSAIEIPSIAKAIAAALGIPLAIGAGLAAKGAIEDQSNITASQRFRDKSRIETFGEDENRFIKRNAPSSTFMDLAKAAVAATFSASPSVAPSVSTPTNAPPIDPRLQDYVDTYLINKHSRDRDAGTTTVYDVEADPLMIQITNQLQMMSFEDRQAAVMAIMDKHTQEMTDGGPVTFTEAQMQHILANYSKPNPSAEAAAAAAAAAAASGGGGGKGADIVVPSPPPVFQAPPANTGVPEPTTWAEQMARYQDMQNMFNKPVPEPDRTRENELYALLQSSQAKQDQLTQQYMELLMKQLNQQQQPQPGIPAVPAPGIGSPSGNAFPLSNISQVARQGSNLQFSNAGLGYLNSIDPSLLQALMQYLKRQQYTAMGQMGTYGELNYGRAGGIGPLTMSDASFEDPLNYAGLTSQMREPAEAGLRSVFAQMGLMG